MDWQDISTAPEGNDTDGPFFDVTWLGERHRYLPVPKRAINCYKQNGVVKVVHGYPAVWTTFRPQPTHWMPIPPPPSEDTE